MSEFPSGPSPVASSGTGTGTGTGAGPDHGTPAAAAIRAAYLQRILRARVYDVAIESPLDPAPGLSNRLHNRVLLKREDLQPVFSFKLRGAYNLSLIHI